MSNPPEQSRVDAGGERPPGPAGGAPPERALLHELRMLLNAIVPRSLKTRLTLLTLLVFVIGIWSLAFYVSRMLQQDMERQLGEQQFSAVSYMAAEVDDELQQRLRALELIAGSIDASLLARPAALQKLIEQRPLMQLLFNAGVFVTGADGVAVAELPLLGRIGVNYMDKDHVAAALRQGKATVGKPVVGRRVRAPSFAITVPIRDARGTVIGALAGAIDLSRPNFLGKVTSSSYGKTGGYLIIAREHRLIVTATEARFIMAPLLGVGAIPLIDRFVEGYEGSGVLVNQLGEQRLASTKGIPTANWYLTASLPTAEAFAPVRAMQQRMLLATLTLTLLACCLIWWACSRLLRRQLAPMLEATRALTALSVEDRPPQQVPVTSRDEIGELVGGFNRVLGVLAQREQSLRASEEQTRGLLAAMPDGVLTHRGGRIEYANQTLLRMLGLEGPEALVGHAMSEFVPPWARADLAGFVALASSGAPAVATEVQVMRSDGSLLSVEVSAASLRAGDTLRIVVIRDLSERKRAEEALRSERALLQQVTTSSPVGIVTVDRGGRITFANAAAEAMLGLKKDQITQLEYDAPQWRHTDLEGKPLAPERLPVARVLATGRPVFEVEHGIQWPDGRRVLLSVNAAPLLDGAGTLSAVVAAVSDITERKRLEQVHLQAQKLESLGTLAGGIAHDFNNVLAAICGYADMAAEDVGPDHLAAESLGRIQKAGVRATELVRRITAFGRTRAARQVRVNLGDVVQEVLELLRATLPARIALRTAFAADTPAVAADAGQVHEAVVNLTTNAAYAISPHAGEIEYRLEPVQVDAELARGIAGLAPGRYARLTVTDDGAGMDAATLERVFDAFYTTKPVGEGTGLGLSMVHGIMASHGGAVTVQSSPGKGASFQLYFIAAEQNAGNEEPATGETMAPGARQRVLYVDDEEALVSLVKRMFARLGHGVDGFTDPQQALEAFRSRPQDYDVVVTDLAMPAMSGFDLARAVLALRPDTPVLVTTGYVRPEDEVVARQIGVREFILKPVASDELARVLDRLSHSRHGRP